MSYNNYARNHLWVDMYIRNVETLPRFTPCNPYNITNETIIADAFTWSASPERYDFWSKIWDEILYKTGNNR